MKTNETKTKKQLMVCPDTIWGEKCEGCEHNGQHEAYENCLRPPGTCPACVPYEDPKDDEINQLKREIKINEMAINLLKEKIKKEKHPEVCIRFADGSCLSSSEECGGYNEECFIGFQPQPKLIPYEEALIMMKKRLDDE